MATFLVKSAAQQVGSLLAEEGKFLYKVHDKIKGLQTELEWMEGLLEDADKRQNQEELVWKLVAEITEFAYEAENIIERYLHEVSDQQRDGIWDTIKWFSNIRCACRAGTRQRAWHSLGLGIDELIPKVSKRRGRLQTYGINIISPTESLAYNVRVREERQTYSHVEEEVVGLDKDVEQLVAHLKGEQVNVVSVTGMTGSGKSTLAKKVLGDKTIKQHFRNNCVWVYISKEFSRRNVFEEILIGLSVSGKDEGVRKNIKDLTEEELAKNINELLQNKKCLVLLDDIWATRDWDSLKPALELQQNKKCHSKLLLTTVNCHLLHHVDAAGYSHPMEPLNVEDSWKLLQIKAFPQRSTVESSTSTHNQMGQDELQAESSTSTHNQMGQDELQAESSTSTHNQMGQDELQAESSTSTHNQMGQDELQVDHGEKPKKEKLGREMLKHCHGFPLAIIALGGILSSKRKVDDWKEVLKNIRTYMADGELLPVLELSYYDLPFYLKPCLLYLANFPKGYEISTERLYHLWEAEGIIEVPTKVDTRAEDVILAFDLGERYLNELIQRSMVKVGRRWASSERIKTCWVHHLIRDVCIRKCKELSFLNVQEYSNFNMQSIVAECDDITKRVHHCAIHVREGIVKSHRSDQHQRKAPYVRSLLIFLLNKSSSEVGLEKKEFANMVNCFSSLRVLDLEDIGINTEEWKSVHLIHLRYLSLKNMRIGRFSSRFWGSKYLVTLDLRAWGSPVELRNNFHHMERLRHLYLPEQFSIIDGDRLTFRAHQMETLRNFDPENCDIKDLSQMTNLRIFSITKLYEFASVKDLKALAETSVIKSGHQLVNPLLLRIKVDVIEEDPSILVSIFNSNNPLSLIKLVLRKWHSEWDSEVLFHKVDIAIKKGDRVFPNSLTKLSLDNCEVSEQVELALEKLPHLQVLCLNFSDNKKLSFSDGSFQCLKLLVLNLALQLKEWEVGEGAIPALQRLVINRCGRLAKLPDGLPNSVDINCWRPCIMGIEKYNTCPHFTGNF